MGPASATIDTVRANLPASAAPLFDDLLPVIWRVVPGEGVDPVVVAAQAAKETGWGRFGGAVTPDMHNPCGLKRAGASGDRREDHASFPSWDVGVLAQCQHLMGYAGVVPRSAIVDPRWSAVAPGAIRHGIASVVGELGGLVDPGKPELGSRWAPSPTYGTEIETIVRTLRAGARTALAGLGELQEE